MSPVEKHDEDIVIWAGIVCKMHVGIPFWKPSQLGYRRVIPSIVFDPNLHASGLMLLDCR